MSSKILTLLLFSASTLLFAAPERHRFAVYFGGSGADYANAVALDSDGNAYMTARKTGPEGREAVFVSKVDANGSELKWTTALRGRSTAGVAVDAQGTVWVSGEGYLARLNPDNGRVEQSIDTDAAERMALDGAGAVYLAGNGFVAKYAGMQKVYSIAIGGRVRGLAVDGEGKAYVSYGGMVSRVSADGSSIEKTVALGWEATALAVDGLGSVYLTGSNARVAKLGANADVAGFEVNLGGVLEQEGNAIALDGLGNIYVAGWTSSSDFAGARGWHGERDGFVARLNAAGEVLDVTFAGTAARDVLEAMAVTANGDVYVAGWTEGSGLGSGPLGQWQGGTDGLLMKFAAAVGGRAITGTTTTLAAAPAGAATLGQAVVLTATVTPAGGTGKVTFYDGVEVLGTGTLNGGGTATFTATNLQAGARSLRAFYAGDVNFSASTSANIAYTVNVTPSSTFSPLAGSTTAVGMMPSAIGVGDFNGDGRADAAVVNSSANSVTILLSNGTGGYTQAAGSPVASPGVGPFAIAVSDFNLDGLADLAVSNINSNSVGIFLGNGAGGFTTSSVAIGGTPNGLVAADFNGDGKPDIAATRFGSSSVAILLGNGSGGFTATATAVSTQANPANLAVGDFNQDGKTDLVVTSFTGNAVSIFLGDGAGAFTAAAGSPVTTDFGPISIAVADLNGDGRQDLAVANLVGPNISILLGNGAGGFTSAGTAIATGSGPRTIVALDYNGDGRTDLALTNSVANTLTILQGNGAGGFTAAIGSPLATEAGPTDLARGDFNGDGRVDLLYASGTANTVTLLPGTGNAPFPLSGTPVATSTSP
jgi:hypothetical protein